MGTDTVTSLAPPIERVFEASAAGSDLCATITLSNDATCWIQVTRSELNLAYGHARDPAAVVVEIGLPSWAGLSLLDWEPNSYATFEFNDSLGPLEVASIASALFIDVAGAPPGHDVKVEIFEIPPA